MKYVLLLRGINVGGNNKVAMSDLKACLQKQGCEAVETYINSGNVVFEYPQTDLAGLVESCEAAIQAQFGFRVVCAVITADSLLAAVRHAPSWWNVGDAKHNAIFVIPPKKAADIITVVGAAKPEYEQVAAYDPIIFWSAPLESFSRTRYSKIVGTEAYQWVTIRNANTTLKLAQMCQ